MRGKKMPLLLPVLALWAAASLAAAPAAAKCYPMDFIGPLMPGDRHCSPTEMAAEEAADKAAAKKAADDKRKAEAARKARQEEAKRKAAADAAAKSPTPPPEEGGAGGALANVSPCANGTQSGCPTAAPLEAPDIPLSGPYSYRMDAGGISVCQTGGTCSPLTRGADGEWSCAAGFCQAALAEGKKTLDAQRRASAGGTTETPLAEGEGGTDGMIAGAGGGFSYGAPEIGSPGGGAGDRYAGMLVNTLGADMGLGAGAGGAGGPGGPGGGGAPVVNLGDLDAQTGVSGAIGVDGATFETLKRGVDRSATSDDGAIHQALKAGKAWTGDKADNVPVAPSGTDSFGTRSK